MKSRRARTLGLKPRTQVSPVMEKCCLAASAKSSYQEAEQDIELMMGMKVGHSVLQRMVLRSEIPEAQSQQPVKALSVDGGNMRLRTAETGPCVWRNYKAVSLHDTVCAAYFQDNQALVDWVQWQPLRSVVLCIGDGHDGIWNVIKLLAPEYQRREILDWYHLMENLYKIDPKQCCLERLKALLWSGFVDEVLAILKPLPHHPAQCFRAYLRKHRRRLVNYCLYQSLGLDIGSGSVESTVKRIAARVKLTGAQWLSSSAPHILRLRCAYLNGAFVLSNNT
ncbi:ISKra4 family transposase [Spirulina major]|uniref:ISKra4 family transposase n=1 Tax=Spirulina major TaxID=270636 RepID=UPI001FE68144|nr:ISKra4 family transposase [Spirulina major]